MKTALVVLSVLALTTAFAAPASAAETAAPEIATGEHADACTVDIGLVKVCGLCVYAFGFNICVI